MAPLNDVDVPAQRTGPSAISGPVAGSDGSEASREELDAVVQLFRAVAEISAHAMTVCSPSGRLLVVNAAYAELAGRPVSELVGIRYNDITHPDDRVTSDAVTDLALANRERAATIDKRFVRPDGTVVYARVSATILWAADGSQLCYVTQVTDLTELREATAHAEISEARARRVVSSSADAYVSIDAAGIIREWNPAAVRLFGWSRTDALGQALAELLIPEPMRAAHAAGMENYARTGESSILGHPVELVALRADGSTVPVEVTLWAAVEPDGSAAFHAFLRDISARKEAAAAANRHSLVYASITDAVFLSAGGIIIETNPAGEELFGRTRDELIGATTMSLLDPDTDIRAADVRAAALTEGLWSGDVPFTRPDGQRRISAALIRPVTGIDGEMQGFLAVHRDVTEARAATQAIVAAEARYRLIAENSSDVISQVALDGTVLYVSPSYERVFGYPPSGVVGGRIGPNIHPDDASALHDAFARVVAGESVRLVSRRQRADGAWLWLESSNEPIRDADTGAIVGVQSAVRDITARRAAEAELERLALTDSLTGLANRVRLADRLYVAQQRLNRGPGNIALRIVDMDGFKAINDTYGHAAGDTALTETAARLLACARPTDTVARLGGDEFAVLLDGLADPAHADLVAARILEALRQPLDLPEFGSVDIRASIGVAVTDDPHLDADQLHRRADAALYRAKAAGRDRHANH